MDTSVNIDITGCVTFLEFVLEHQNANIQRVIARVVAPQPPPPASRPSCLVSSSSFVLSFRFSFFSFFLFCYFVFRYSLFLRLCVFYCNILFFSFFPLCLVLFPLFPPLLLPTSIVPWFTFTLPFAPFLSHSFPHFLLCSLPFPSPSSLISISPPVLPPVLPLPFPFSPWRWHGWRFRAPIKGNVQYALWAGSSGQAGARPFAGLRLVRCVPSRGCCARAGALPGVGMLGLWALISAHVLRLQWNTDMRKCGWILSVLCKLYFILRNKARM